MDADGDEKLTELKKAYADMILNTTKEAAARIMASERKALRLEFELKTSKEDALQMLMKLKLMMDVKINEVEMASRTQQKKLEELEAQLQEAEDIVKDLREELRAVQAELERASPRKEVQLLVQVNEGLEKNVFSNPYSIAFPPPEEQPNIFPPFDIANSDQDQSNKGQRLYNSSFPFRKSYIEDQDLPAIILRSKGTKLYRSGCTQRIHACERTLLDRELSLPEQMNHIKPDLITKADEEGEKLRKTHSLEDERKKSRKRASPNRKKRSLSPNQLLDLVKEMDHVADNSFLITARSVKHSIKGNSVEGINTSTGLVRVSDIHRRIREELELLPMGREKTELPLSSEAQVGPPESKALETGEVPIQPPSSRVIKYTFQRKRKRGTLSTDGSDLKKKEENKSAPLESDKVISIEESTQDERHLEQVAEQLILLSEKKWWQ